MTWTAMVFGFLWRGYPRGSHFNRETDNLVELGSTYEDVSQEIWRCFSGPVPTRGGVIHGTSPIAPSRHSKGTSPCSTGKHGTSSQKKRGFPWLYHPTNWQPLLLVPGAPKSIAWACTAGHASDGGRFYRVSPNSFPRWLNSWLFCAQFGMKSISLKTRHKFIHWILRFTLNFAKFLWKIRHSSMIFLSIRGFPIEKPMEIHRCRAMVSAMVRSQSFRDAGEAFNVRAPRLMVRRAIFPQDVLWWVVINSG